jgi:hypothetical protein
MREQFQISDGHVLSAVPASSRKAELRAGVVGGPLQHLGLLLPVAQCFSDRPKGTHPKTAD